MANENRITNELVSATDEPAAEVNALTVRKAFDRIHRMSPAESDEKTFDAGNGAANGNDDLVGLRYELGKRSELIERLQFDIEQLRAKWLGLDAELEAREEVTANLARELSKSRNEVSVATRRIGERDESIASLEAKLREKDARTDELEERLRAAEAANAELRAGTEVEALQKRLAEYEGLVSGQNAALAQLRAQQERTEAYADALRRQYADVNAELEQTHSERGRLRESLSAAEKRIETLTSELARAAEATDAAESRLSDLGHEHERELRQLRFELDEAKETIAEHETISEQLASDLVDTRGFKQELERMLSVNSANNESRIEELEDQVALLESTIAAYEDELEAKADAINCLLDEMSGESGQPDPIGEIEHAIHDLDDRMSERIETRPAPSADRVARLLVGRIDRQELRFPLFKNRLTIGRTRQNDIQLKADYVSRRHAVVVTEGTRTRVIDWGSKNGVYVNSKRVKEHFLRNGDILAIGTAKFRYEERVKRDN